MMELRAGKEMSKREESFQPDSGFPIKLAAPAKRALANAGYTQLEQLASVSEDDVKKLHGIGPNAVKLLIQALRDKGLSFKSNQ
jgi:hypothetical protein